MKIEFKSIYHVPQVASVMLAGFAINTTTTHLEFCGIVACVVINLVAVAYCSFCMERGLTIPKIHYYEKTALLWESVAEELRKEGKFACLDTFADTLVKATRERDKE